MAGEGTHSAEGQEGVRGFPEYDNSHNYTASILIFIYKT
jgi:hypothetical protein